MLKIHIDSAFYETIVITPTGVPKRVTKSKISVIQEALVFVGGDGPKEAFVSLPDLNESVRLHFIMSGAEGAPEFGPPGSQRERVWLRPKNSSNTIIKKANHLVRNFMMFGGCWLILIHVSCVDTTRSTSGSRWVLFSLIHGNVAEHSISPGNHPIFGTILSPRFARNPSCKSLINLLK
jgi:hypothetical protein